MKTRLLIILNILLIATFTNAQNTGNPLFHTIEGSVEFGSGGGDYGVQIKANHQWTEDSKLTLMSSVSFSSFWGSEANDGIFSTSKGFTTDNHLRLYSGFNIIFLKKLYFGIEGYLGGYNTYTKGTFTNDGFGIDTDFKSSDWLFDYGSRLQIGYQLKEKLGVQLTLNNSWKQTDSGLGVLAGLFAGEPDGKMSFGISVNYKLN